MPAHRRGLSCGKTSSEVTNDAVAVWAAVGWNRKKHDDKERFSSKDFLLRKDCILVSSSCEAKGCFRWKVISKLHFKSTLTSPDKFCNYSSSKSHFCSNSESQDNFDYFCSQKFASNQVLRGQFDCFCCKKQHNCQLIIAQLDNSCKWSLGLYFGCLLKPDNTEILCSYVLHHCK